MTDEPAAEDAERILQNQIRHAQTKCRKCERLSPELREEQFATALREIRANRARVLVPLAPAAWTQGK